MFALGQKQTFAVQIGMSALLPKADIDRRTRKLCRQKPRTAAIGQMRIKSEFFELP